MLERSLLSSLKPTYLLCLLFALVFVGARVSFDRPPSLSTFSTGIGIGNEADKHSEEDPHKDASLAVGAV
jgi:hypothetical protein